MIKADDKSPPRLLAEALFSFSRSLTNVASGSHSRGFRALLPVTVFSKFPHPWWLIWFAIKAANSVPTRFNYRKESSSSFEHGSHKVQFKSQLLPSSVHRWGDWVPLRLRHILGDGRRGIGNLFRKSIGDFSIQKPASQPSLNFPEWDSNVECIDYFVSLQEWAESV